MNKLTKLIYKLKNYVLKLLNEIKLIFKGIYPYKSILSSYKFILLIIPSILIASILIIIILLASYFKSFSNYLTHNARTRNKKWK